MRLRKESIEKNAMESMANTSYGWNQKLKVHPVVRKLVGRIFVGEFTGRTYVNCLQLFRDTIVVDREEKEFIALLREFQKHIQEIRSNKWLGVQWDVHESNEYCTILVNLQGLILGKHWFQVKSITFTEKEIFLKLEWLRTIRDNIYQTSGPLVLSDIQINTILSKENAVAALRFSTVLVMTLCAFIVNAAVYTLDYLIKFIYATAALADALTPTFLSTLEFLGRCVAGFFWLILRLWMGNTGPPMRHKPMLRYRPSPRRLQ